MRVKLNITTTCNTSNEQIEQNIRANALMNYPYVKWEVATRSPCAVVGGGPGLPSALPYLRDWPGDIFAVNDTAGYLSDNGIPSYLFMIDALPNDPVRRGDLIKGAVLASRCHPEKFFVKDIRLFDMLEENRKTGVEGGPTAACRAPHLFLRMGYMGVGFFAAESCFFGASHVTGYRPEAFDHLVIVRVGETDYLTNVVLLDQAQYLAKKILRHPKLLTNYSGGLLKALIENNNDWQIVGVSKDVREQCPDMEKIFTQDSYTGKIWQPNA